MLPPEIILIINKNNYYKNNLDIIIRSHQYV